MSEAFMHTLQTGVDQQDEEQSWLAKSVSRYQSKVPDDAVEREGGRPHGGEVTKRPKELAAGVGGILPYFVFYMSWLFPEEKVTCKAGDSSKERRAG